MPALPPTASALYVSCQPFIVLPILSNVSTRDITSIPWYQADRRSHARCRRNAWFFKICSFWQSNLKIMSDDLWGYCQKKTKTMKWSLNSTATAFCIIKVRIMVATLLEIGNGKRPVHDFCGCMKSKTAMNVEETAPASGLYLKKVYYEDKIWLDFTIYWKL